MVQLLKMRVLWHVNVITLYTVSSGINSEFQFFSCNIITVESSDLFCVQEVNEAEIMEMINDLDTCFIQKKKNCSVFQAAANEIKALPDVSALRPAL